MFKFNSSFKLIPILAAAFIMPLLFLVSQVVFLPNGYNEMISSL